MRKYAGVLGVLIFSTTTIIIVIAGYRSPAFTISNHTSLNIVAQVSFCVFGCIASVLLGYSLLVYIPRKWKLGRVYRIIAAVVAVSFFTACLFPNDPNAYTMHDYASWSTMFSGFVLAAFTVVRLWLPCGRTVRIMNILVPCVMLSVFITQIVNYAFFRSFILVYESSFILALFALVLTLILGQPQPETAESEAVRSDGLGGARPTLLVKPVKQSDAGDDLVEGRGSPSLR